MLRRGDDDPRHGAASFTLSGDQQAEVDQMTADASNQWAMLKSMLLNQYGIAKAYCQESADSRNKCIGVGAVAANNIGTN